MIIGITGKSGCGKSTYARKLGENTDFYVVDIDKIGHKILNLPELREEFVRIFGNSVIKNNSIDRKYIGDLIFQNRHLYEDLTKIVWTKMKSEIDSILSEHKNVILEWILLPHTHYWKLCDTKILVTCEDTSRISRVLIRDNISKEYLSKRDSASMDYSEITFDKVIDTTDGGYI